MNKDQVTGTIKDIAGKVQEEAGKLVGSEGQQIKGLGKQIVGKTEKNYGNAKEVVKNLFKTSWLIACQYRSQSAVYSDVGILFSWSRQFDEKHMSESESSTTIAHASPAFGPG